MIKQLKIANVHYDVSEVENLEDENGEYYGKVSHLDLTIKVEKNMSDVVKTQCLVHEALHALFHHTGHFDIEQEERIVQMLGCQLPQFLRDNPELVQRILEETS